MTGNYEKSAILRQKIIDLIANNPGCEVYFIRQNIDRSSACIRKYLHTMKNEELLESCGSRMHHQYYIFGAMPSRIARMEVDVMPIKRIIRPVRKSDICDYPKMNNPFAQMVFNTLGSSV